MKKTYLFRITAAVLCFAVVLLCFDGFWERSFAEEQEPQVTEEPADETQGAVSTAPEYKKPGKVKSLKLSSKKESQVKVTWKKVKCSGYILTYSRNKDLKNAARKKIGRKATSITIKGLAKGKVYYFRIRAYRSYKKKVVYGKYSETKNIRVHKHVYKPYVSSIKTGTLTTYKCSCGKGYYRTQATDGKTYDGYLYKFPSCVPGQIKEKIGGKTHKLSCTKAHKPVKGADGRYTCSRCGQKMRIIRKTIAPSGVQLTSEEADPEPQEVLFEAPKSTNSDSCVAASVQSADGKRYNYKLYWQKSKALKFKYSKYRAYFAMHGCSTCALTAVLNATVPKYKNYTPDRVLVEVIKPVVGAKTFKKNFSKSLRKQMPIGLRGISKVLKANGVKHKYVYKYTKKSAAKEIRAHLEKGKPVIFMIRRSTYAYNPHMMVMLGLDKKGRVIVGDSCLSSASKWGTNNRLIKYNTRKKTTSNTVENICKYFKDSTNSVKGVGSFYDGRKGNIGYILVD